MPKPRPTVFISGVSREFASFRDAVEIEVQMKGCFPENQPGFPPDYLEVEEVLRRKIMDADVIVHIVGFRFGAEPRRRPSGLPRRSYTQMEFDIARQLGKPIYLFLSNKDTVRDGPRPDEEPEDEEAVKLQISYREFVRQSNYQWHHFKDVEELRRLVAEIGPIAGQGRIIDITRIDRYSPIALIGREEETKLLDAAWMKVRKGESHRDRVISFVALGGEGKTSLVAKWAADLALNDWPGCDAAFAWSFYSQGTRLQGASSSDLFLNQALEFFGDPLTAASSISSYEKGKRLARLVGSRRALLILDGLEPLQFPPTAPIPGELRDAGIAVLLKSLATSSSGLCLVTTRYHIPDLRNYYNKTVSEVELLRLSTEAGVTLLRSLGVKGSLRRNIRRVAYDRRVNEYEALVEDVKGHALTLHLLGAYLRDARNGDIQTWKQIRLGRADHTSYGGHAFRVLDHYVNWLKATDGSESALLHRASLSLLYALGLFDQPIELECLRSMYEEYPVPVIGESLAALTQEDFDLVLARLEAAKLIQCYRNNPYDDPILDTHPLIREYFEESLTRIYPYAWEKANDRLYNYFISTWNNANENKEGLSPSRWGSNIGYFRASRSRKKNPTLQELQPLYRAILHGCRARRSEEAFVNIYIERIQQSERAYSTSILGALASDLGALACFYSAPWGYLRDDLSPKARSAILNETGYTLRALGRLREARMLLRESLGSAVEEKEWEAAAIRSTNLGEVYLLNGELPAAYTVCATGVRFAKASDSPYRIVIETSILADVMFQQGHEPTCVKLYAQAEQLHSTARNSIQLLFSGTGFRYCEFQLRNVERDVWRKILGIDRRNLATTALSTIKQVRKRATETLKVSQEMEWIQDIGLDQLTLAKSDLFDFLYHQIDGEPVANSINQAITALRIANQQDDVVRGLLVHAWFLSLPRLERDRSSAVESLDEAWEIASKGPMRLHMADVHLYRARLFFREEGYPWGSPAQDLSGARKLIQQCGYWRRKEELEDAERVILGRVSSAV